MCIRDRLSRARTSSSAPRSPPPGCRPPRRISPLCIRDSYELEDIFARLPNVRDGERKREDYRRMMTLYRGALLQKSELNEWAYPRAVTLHNQYIACLLYTSHSLLSASTGRPSLSPTAIAPRSSCALSLIHILIANRGEPVSNRRLLSTFWNDENVTNPCLFYTSSTSKTNLRET